MSSPAIRVRVGRTESIVVDFEGADVSGSTFSAQVRRTQEPTSSIIATWTISMAQASTGILTLTLDNSVTAAIPIGTIGYTDLVETVSGEPTTVFDFPLEVQFVGAPTA